MNEKIAVLILSEYLRETTDNPHNAQAKNALRYLINWCLLQNSDQ
jgi:hypothetical protein